MLILCLLALLMCGTYGAPLSSCDTQASCVDIAIIDVEATDSNGNKQYELCFYWDKTLSGCAKDDTISHACPSVNDESDKIEGWAAGTDNALCNVVSCGESATWGIKDGSYCKDSSSLIDFGGDISMKCSDGGSCGGKNAKACQWTLSAPECDATTSSTTTSTTAKPEATPEDDATTSSTTSTSTTAEPTECTCDTLEYEPCLEKDACVLSAVEGGTCICHDCDCDLINLNADIRGVDSIQIQCEACGLCTYSDADGSCGAISSANTYARVKDVIYYSKDEMSLTNEDGAEDVNEKGGLGYVVLPIETLIVAGAALVLLLLIAVCAGCIWKRMKEKGKGEIVPDQEEFHDVQITSQF